VDGFTSPAGSASDSLHYPSLRNANVLALLHRGGCHAQEISLAQKKLAENQRHGHLSEGKCEASLHILCAPGGSLGCAGSLRILQSWHACITELQRDLKESTARSDVATVCTLYQALYQVLPTWFTRGNATRSPARSQEELEAKSNLLLATKSELEELTAQEAEVLDELVRRISCTSTPTSRSLTLV
jgi:hypothetical protein